MSLFREFSNKTEICILIALVPIPTQGRAKPGGSQHLTNSTAYDKGTKPKVPTTSGS
jgi:hypothetical protein